MSDIESVQEVNDYEKKIKALEAENKELKKRKKFGLAFEHKPDAQALRISNEMPVLKEDTSKVITNGVDDVNHVLISGDNFHALTALRATHANKVDVIYIDPPYNTGNKDFIYNDNYLDKEDGYRHSKWLSFMDVRLKIARELLSDTGIIFVSIDDNEHARLRLLMDDIFGADNFVDTIMVELSATQGMKVGAAKKGAIVKNGEYVLIYSKSELHSTVRRTPLYNRVYGYDTHYNLWLGENGELIPVGKILYENLAVRTELERLGIKASKESFSINALNSCIDFSKIIKDFVIANSELLVRCHTAPATLNSQVFNLPSNCYATINNGKRSYILGKDRKDQVIQYFPLSMNLRESDDFKPSYGRTVIRGDFWKDFWLDMGNISKEGGVEFKNGKKPVRLIKQLAKWAVGTKPNSIILDFFAGSGTTAHAVAELNKEDGGRRQCILVTDGGKSEETGESSKNSNENVVHIAEEITYERVRRVLTGKGWADGKEHDALGGNLHYMNIEMLPVTNNATYSDKYSLVNSSISEFAKIDSSVFETIERVDTLSMITFERIAYTVLKSENSYVVAIESHDYELDSLKSWVNTLEDPSIIKFYGSNLDSFDWMLNTDDIGIRIVGSHAFSANLLNG